MEGRRQRPGRNGVEVVRALGFFGFMASGVHRPHQLLAVARGRSGH
jgi:hypothetical protein